LRKKNGAVVIIKTKPSRHGKLAMQLLAGVMCAALVVSSLPQPVRAQDSAATSEAASSTENQGYSSEQLDALLAPIALYPDQLLTQILMAATYPDEVKAADAWVKDPAHKGLTGTALDQRSNAGKLGPIG
jgi:hypothetical protein